MVAFRRDELAVAQLRHRGLDRAAGQARFIGDGAEPRGHRTPPLPHRPAIEVEIDEEGRGLPVVADDIAQQHIEHVIVDGDGSFETRHGRKG